MPSSPEKLILFRSGLIISKKLDHSRCLSNNLNLKPKVLLERHEKIFNLPNMLTFSRLISAPVIGTLIIYDQHAYALSLLGYAALTDLVDGYLARHVSGESVLGSALDPIADKTLMSILVAVFWYKSLLPVWLVCLIFGRDFALLTAGAIIRYVSLPGEKSLSKYFDFSLPTVQVKPTMISKINTALQLGLVLLCTTHPFFGMSELYITIMSMLEYIVGVTTFWSGMSYVFSANAIKLINQQ